MTRPAGEPAAIVGGSRSLAGAAATLQDVRGRLRGATSFVVVAGAWKGPASEAFLIDGSGAQTGLDRAAQGLDHAAAALSELAARLDHAQTTWDRAHRLAASVGVDLSRHVAGMDTPVPVPRSAWNPRGGVLSPADAVDPAATLVAGQAIRMAVAAEHEAAAARRAAAARLDQAATRTRVPASAPSHGGAAGTAGSRGRGDHAGHAAAGNGAREGANGHGAERHEGTLRRMVGRALEAGAEVATATHHLVAAAEARLQAAARLAMTADDPAVRSAAAGVAQGAARPMMEGRMVGMVGVLPLVAPVMDFTAAVSDGEPLPRALAGAVGGAVGADLGGRLGIAACGGEAAVTQGAGLIVCPALAAAGGALGAHAGKTAALHLYDKIAGPSEAPPTPPDPAHPGAAGAGADPGHAEAAGARAHPRPDPVTPGSAPRLESQPFPEPRPESRPDPQPRPDLEPGLGSRPDPRPVLTGSGG
jgi:uncharacterized protein YukE